MLPAIPAAARAAQQAAAEALTGTSVVPPSNPYDDPDLYMPRSRKGRKLVRLLKEIGLPDWKKREIRRHARRNRTLDPDIASLQSVSLSGKVAIQWRRNEAKAHATLFDRIIDREAEEEWHKANDSEYF